MGKKYSINCKMSQDVSVQKITFVNSHWRLAINHKQAFAANTSNRYPTGMYAIRCQFNICNMQFKLPQLCWNSTAKINCCHKVIGVKYHWNCHWSPYKVVIPFTLKVSSVQPTFRVLEGLLCKAFHFKHYDREQSTFSFMLIEYYYTNVWEYLRYFTENELRILDNFYITQMLRKSNLKFIYSIL